MAAAIGTFGLALLQAVAPGRLPGDSMRLGDGIVSSWVEVNAGGAPSAIGVTLPDDVIATVPDTGVMLSLSLPQVEGVPFRHVLFDWVPTGHPPAALYAHPHWDAHFYLITPEERRSIAEGATNLRPAAGHMPDGYLPVPGLGLYAFPEMGVHWMHETARELHGQTFDQTLIYGSIGERTIFVEPMFTSAFLERRGDFSAPIPQPRAVAADGYYPTRYAIRYVPAERVFRVSLEEFRWRDVGEPDSERRSGGAR